MTQQLAQWLCLIFSSFMTISLLMRWFEKAGGDDKYGAMVYCVSFLVWFIFLMLMGEAGTFTMIF